MKHSKEPMRQWVAAQALEWFIAHRSGALSEAQRQEFIEWLRASPAHAREYLELTGFVKDVGEAARANARPAEELVASARAEPDTVQFLPTFVAEDTETKPRRTNWNGMRLRAALVAVAAVMIAFATWWLHDRTVYSTAHAEQRSWRMPDGSTVHLNSSSEIKVRFDGQRREVDLIRGQALFQVAKDPQRPFWVHAGEAVVQAVGTEFDVYRQPRRTLISVVEGRVAVWRSPDSPAGELSGVGGPVAQLNSGQQAHITRGSTVVSERAADVRKTVAWLQRQVIFDHDPLGAAVEEFNRYAELQIRIDDPSLRAVEISGIFSAYDAESFIRFLERQPEMQLRRAGDEIVVATTDNVSSIQEIRE
ncbi:MAG TPA: FecR domain-containing protein [Steroidobacter sp.]|uniref:FecR family protein n=1 Tax=Steroidobacter sp. TaxID=1978227 RepID=UPI002EDAD3FC